MEKPLYSETWLPIGARRPLSLPSKARKVTQRGSDGNSQVVIHRDTSGPRRPVFSPDPPQLFAPSTFSFVHFAFSGPIPIRNQLFMRRITSFLLPALLLCTGTAFVTGCSGSDTTVRSRADQNPPESTLNLQELIDKTPDGGTVTIPLARYVLSDGLRVHNRTNLTISCAPGSQILVDDISADVLEIANSTDIRIEGAFLRHLKPLPEYECHGDVLKMRGSENIVVENSELDGCGAIGVAVWQSRNIKVKQCLIQNNSFNALYFEGAENVHIADCVIQDNANLFQMYRSQDVQMSGNIIRRNGGYWEEPETPGLRK